MQQGTVKIRRGKRTDFPALRALLTPTVSVEANKSEKAQVRHWRRLASDPAHDFYVAEQEGTIRGMVLVSYIRGLTHHGWQAILDLAAPMSAACDIGQALLNFAKARARKRGCQRLLVCVSDQEQEERLTSLCQAGFLRTGAVFSCGLL